MQDRVLDFAVSVVDGKRIAGPSVRAACRRHLNDLETASKRGLVWDLSSANRIYSYFEHVLRLNGGEFEGKPFIMEPWQAFVSGSIFGWKSSDGFRRFRTAFVETAKGPLALDTPVATASGWTTMGEIKVGDQVFNSRGELTRVAAVSPVFYGRECFRLTFSDGAEIVADAEHEWMVSSHRNGKRFGPRPDAKIGMEERRSTKYISKTYKMPVSSSKHPQAKYNHKVCVAPPLACAVDVPLVIPPYTFGVWLGDGDSDGARVTSADCEILAEVEKEGYALGGKAFNLNGRAFRQNVGRNYGAGGRTLKEQLRELGVLNNKHIPLAYLRAGVQQRLSLLQGLMDTDGFVSAGGACELTLCNARLAYDAADLLRTLGFKCVVKKSQAKLNGRVVGDRWRICFKGFRSFPPFRLSRKVERLGKEHGRKKLSASRRIIACTPVESVPVRCITVESDDHMFLAGRQLVPTCNSGKSPFAAGIGIYMLTADNEPRAEVYAVATTRDQAMVLFRDALAMHEQSPELFARLIKSGVGHNAWNLAYGETGGFFRPISSDRANGKSGPRPHCSLCDEVHEHSSRDVVEFMIAGMKGRRQPLTFMITNSGSNRTTVCYEYHEHGRKVAAGDVIDDSFFSFICDLDDGDDPFRDKNCWVKANPSLGVTIKEKYLEDQVSQARGIPSKEGTVRRLNFCQWTDSVSHWIGEDIWEKAQTDFDVESMRGFECFCGLDLSGKRDLTARADVWRGEDGIFYADVKFWTPAETMEERERTDRVPYKTWSEDERGFLEAIKGRAIDYVVPAKSLAKLIATHNVKGLAFDQYRMDDFRRSLDAEGVDSWIWEGPDKPRIGDGLKLIAHGQGWAGGHVLNLLWMPRSIEVVESLLLKGKLKIRRNPCLTYNSASAVVETDPAGNKKWEKRKSSGRIDGVVALTMALGAACYEASEGRSIYELLAEMDEASKVEKDEDSDFIDYEILKDVRHPRFGVMKERFEEKQARDELYGH